MINFACKSIFTIFLLILSINSFSHHAFTAEFDANAPVNLTGEVIKVDGLNLMPGVIWKLKRQVRKLLGWSQEELLTP